MGDVAGFKSNKFIVWDTANSKLKMNRNLTMGC